MITTLYLVRTISTSIDHKDSHQASIFSFFEEISSMKSFVIQKEKKFPKQNISQQQKQYSGLEFYRASKERH